MSVSIRYVNFLERRLAAVEQLYQGQFRRCVNKLIEFGVTPLEMADILLGEDLPKIDESNRNDQGEK